MSETADEEGAHAYFRSVEEIFVRLRGAPLLLSPADWRVAEGWWKEGIPLRLVEEVLEEIFRRREERGARGRVNSLRYCARAVEAAWEERAELRAPGARREPETLDTEAGLRKLAARLPESLLDRDRWVRRIEGCGGSLREVEDSLRALDDELVSAVEGSLTDDERATLESRVASSLARLEERLPARDLAVVEGQIRRQQVRALRGLPVLTLL